MGFEEAERARQAELCAEPSQPSAMVGQLPGTALRVDQAMRESFAGVGPLDFSAHFDAAFRNQVAAQYEASDLERTYQLHATPLTKSLRTTYVAEASADAAAFLGHEPLIASAGAAWRGAATLGRAAESRFQALEMSFVQQGLGSIEGDQVTFDDAAIEAEARTFSTALPENAELVLPHDPTKTVQGLLDGVQGAASELASALVFKQSDEADDKAAAVQGEIDERAEAKALFDRVFNFVSSVVGAVTDPNPISAAKAVMSFTALIPDREIEDLHTQVTVLKGQARNTGLRGRLEQIAGGIDKLRAAHAALVSWAEDHDEKCQTQTQDLVDRGIELDKKDASNRCGKERYAAMGRHLGDVLATRNYLIAARLAQGCADPAIEKAAETMDANIGLSRVSPELANLHAHSVPAAAWMREVQHMQARLRRHWGDRSQKLEVAVGAIMRQLGPRTESSSK